MGLSCATVAHPAPGLSYIITDAQVSADLRERAVDAPLIACGESPSKQSDSCQAVPLSLVVNTTAAHRGFRSVKVRFSARGTISRTADRCSVVAASVGGAAELNSSGA